MLLWVRLRQLPSNIATDHADGLGAALAMADWIALELDLVSEWGVADHALVHSWLSLPLDRGQVDCIW